MLICYLLTWLRLRNFKTLLSNFTGTDRIASMVSSIESFNTKYLIETLKATPNGGENEISALQWLVSREGFLLLANNKKMSIKLLCGDMNCQQCKEPMTYVFISCRPEKLSFCEDTSGNRCEESAERMGRHQANVMSNVSLTYRHIVSLKLTFGYLTCNKMLQT